MAGPRPCAWPDDASQSSALGSGGLVSESTSAVIDLVEQTHTAPAWEGVFWGCSLRVRVWDSPWGQWGNRRELSSWGPFVLELVGLQGALCRSICPPRRGTADLMTNSQVTRAVCVLDWCAPRPGWLLPTLNHQTIYPSWFCSLVLGVYPPLSPRDHTVYILFGNYDLSWDSLDERDFCNLKFFWHDLWKSESVSCSFVSESFVPQWTVALYPMAPLTHEILQARILEWVAISFSRGSSQPSDGTRVSCVAGGWFTCWATREAQNENEKSKQLLDISFVSGSEISVLPILPHRILTVTL